jgi:hypothetical protein
MLLVVATVCDDDDADNNNNNNNNNNLPERVTNVKGTTMMWDVLVIIDRTILANRPDVVLLDKI